MTVYDVNVWQSSTIYNKWDFITNNSFWYYATTNFTSSSIDLPTDIANGNFAGTAIDGLQTKSFFLWVPSYNFENVSTPRVKLTKFGDGYGQISKDGISNILLSYNLVFEQRGLAETTSLLHFLTQRAGAESFFWIAPAPRNTLKKFICSSWTDKQNFYENYTVQAKFDEVTK